MANITKTDVQNAAQSYVIDRANRQNYGGGAPYSYGNGLTMRQDMLESYVFYSGSSFLGSNLGGSVHYGNFVAAARNMAHYYARIVRGIYGVTGGNTCPDGGSASPWHAYEIFFVQPGYHAGHYNDVVANINAAYSGDVTGNVTWQGMANYLYRLFDQVEARKNNTEVDMRVCHSSCHGSCHSSRGRR